ncbi:Uncharacterized protein dnl_41190 [Desulfonema limicola]|uniref:Uncharacterized protein n=1 Tax=Desulfonema limicola TaxID=45656 RepID=A0A975BAU4_9BACT|nr:Uncharacterized protein dnl_41190 [Desulfonema limicola]
MVLLSTSFPPHSEYAPEVKGVKTTDMASPVSSDYSDRESGSFY